MAQHDPALASSTIHYFAYNAGELKMEAAMAITYIHCPQSNGFAKNGLKKLKGLEIKITERRGHVDEDELTREMIELRNTPGPFGVSPATVVYGFELRSFLPVSERRSAEATKKSTMITDMD